MITTPDPPGRPLNALGPPFAPPPPRFAKAGVL